MCAAAGEVQKTAGNLNGAGIVKNGRDSKCSRALFVKSTGIVDDTAAVAYRPVGCCVGIEGLQDRNIQYTVVTQTDLAAGVIGPAVQVQGLVV